MNTASLSGRLLRSVRSVPFYGCRNISKTSTNFLFWEPDVKSGYNKKAKPVSQWEHIKNGWKGLKREFELFKEEFKEKIETDPILTYQPGVTDKLWVLRSEKDLEQWSTTADSDHGEGFSSCSLSINGLGFGHFSGILDTTTPKDGRIKRSGYCSIRTLRKRRSFQRDDYFDWCQYTHLVLRVRGDGRSYMMNIATSGYFDQLWNDMYHYILYTRGGPYWQITKVPFSKFFFSSKGRIQDIQGAIQLDRVTNFGITAADKVNGPFSLEIDYIGLMYDPSHTEESAYEMYETPKNIVAT